MPSALLRAANERINRLPYTEPPPTLREVLERGPDLTFREPVHGATALGMARYPHPAAGRPQGNPEVAALLAGK